MVETVTSKDGRTTVVSDGYTVPGGRGQPGAFDADITIVEKHGKGKPTITKLHEVNGALREVNFVPVEQLTDAQIAQAGRTMGKALKVLDDPYNDVASTVYGKDGKTIIGHVHSRQGDMRTPQGVAHVSDYRNVGIDGKTTEIIDEKVGDRTITAVYQNGHLKSYTDPAEQNLSPKEQAARAAALQSGAHAALGTHIAGAEHLDTHGAADQKTPASGTPASTHVDTGGRKP